MRIIICGRNYTSRLGMIRAVGTLGHEVHVISTVRKTPVSPNHKEIDAVSKFVRSFSYVESGKPNSLIQKIKSLASEGTEKDIIIPVDDFTASTVDNHIDILKDKFLFPHINMVQGNVTKFMDKSLQKEFALKSNLNVAKGWTLEVIDGEYVLPQDICYPCFPKPQVSFMGNKLCMRRCNNEIELREAIEDVIQISKSCPFVIEEYKKIDKEYAALGFSDGTNVIIPGMIHLLEGGSGSHKGVTLQGKVLKEEKFRNAIKLFSDFIRKLEFVGLFDIDSYESNGTIYFNELNLRFGASGYAITASGVNLPELFIASLLKKESFSIPQITEEKVFTNEKVASEDFYNGFITLEQYRRYLKGADILFVNNPEDPQPYTIFRKDFTKRRLKRFVKRLFHK